MANRFEIHGAQQAACGDVLDETSSTEYVSPGQRQAQVAESCSGLEQNFDPTFATRLALKEKQIQQNYRPIIDIDKWFARRPGTVFRSLLLAEYNSSEPLETGYWRDHNLKGVIADPFMGGGTPIYEANRLGFSVLGRPSGPRAPRLSWIRLSSNGSSICC